MELIEHTTLKPHSILVFYTISEDDTHNAGYVEAHEIANGQVLAGMPLEKKILADLLKTTVKQTKEKAIQKVGFSNLIPKNVLSFQINSDRSERKLLWSVPAKEQMMFFSDSLQIPNGKAFQPNLIFYLDGRCLYVYAYLDSELKADTPLYLAPYHNVDNKGSVCLGNTRVKKVEWIDQIMALYEEVFFNSYFSHAAASIANQLNFNINLFWKEQIRTNKPFPADKLLPLKSFTLQNLISKINSNHTEDE